MRKAFELLLVLIIFYGVYSAFDQLAPMVFNTPKPFHVVGVSLITATLLLVLYAAVISRSTRVKIQKKLDDLTNEVKDRDSLLQKKDQEIKRAQSFKDDLIAETQEQ